MSKLTLYVQYSTVQYRGQYSTKPNANCHPQTAIECRLIAARQTVHELNEHQQEKEKREEEKIASERASERTVNTLNILFDIQT